MGSTTSTEQAVATALENQDVSELRTILRDLSPEQIRALCASYVPGDENQCTILHLASWQDNPDLLAPLLDYAGDLEIRDALGWTPLMTAVNRGSKQNINMLLARGAKVDADWTKGMSLIADAMNYDDPEIISTLMNHGAQVVPTPDMLANGQDQSSFYLLHYAVDDSLFEIVKLLVEKGKVPLNTLDQSGWSPLHLAAGHGNLELVSYLLSKGADVNIKDSQGNTPLAWAREMSATDVIQELTKHGAVADTMWHGEKLEMKTNEERAQEAWAAEESAAGYEGHIEEEFHVQSEPARFEIDVQGSKSTDTGVPVLDPIQRHRSTGNSVY